MLSAPTPLGEAHDFDLFQSGNDTLDDWLRRRAHANQASGASRTYVIAEEWRVVGYYCLASGALDLADAPSSVRRNMPDPIPMAVLGRLAIDRDWQGKGLGAALLQDAVLRPRRRPTSWEYGACSCMPSRARRKPFTNITASSAHPTIP